ncbi:MAG: hypothetical protein PHY43_15870 [Verrucomicrobiales bacterium]|nr:hypothetical protein [Verrucomicrobiales bacterium]
MSIGGCIGSSLAFLKSPLQAAEMQFLRLSNRLKTSVDKRPYALDVCAKISVQAEKDGQNKIIKTTETMKMMDGFLGCALAVRADEAKEFI